jgi:hypothetical protein
MGHETGGLKARVEVSHYGVMIRWGLSHFFPKKTVSDSILGAVSLIRQLERIAEHSPVVVSHGSARYAEAYY